MRKQDEHIEETGREAAASAFQGYPAPTSSYMYTPNQFFDVVLPNASRGCLRLVAYLMRQTLGMSDKDGNPVNSETHVSYQDLINEAGIGRGRIKEAIEEAIAKRYVRCLRFGQPHTPGEAGFSALYALNWDERDEYVTDPERFDGFFEGESCYTRIPNAFFDHTIPNEPLSLVRVVGVVIRHTIGWQVKRGFRRQRVRMSLTDMMRRTGISSRSTINQAVKDALAANHIERLEEGLFDPHNGVAAVWGVRWTDRTDLPTVESVPRSDTHLGKGKGETVPKSNQGDGSEIEPANGSEIEPGTVPKSNQERFQNRTTIEITDLNNRSKQQQTGPGVVAGDSLTLLEDQLRKVGVTATKAKRLLRDEPTEVVRRQVEWFPQRSARDNPAGLLIACIEADLPLPRGVQTSERPTTPEEAFGAAFYAELAGAEGEAMAQATLEDLRQATRLIRRVGVESDDVDKATAELGRRFARFTKAADQGKKTPVRMLSFAVRINGDAFLRVEGDKSKGATKKSTEEARKAHQARFGVDYEEFVAFFAQQVEEDGALVERFEASMDRKVLSRRKLSDRAADQLLAELQDERERRRLLVEFAKEHEALKVPGFWEWDQTRNVEPFREEFSA